MIFFMDNSQTGPWASAKQCLSGQRWTTQIVTRTHRSTTTSSCRGSRPRSSSRQIGWTNCGGRTRRFDKCSETTRRTCGPATPESGGASTRYRAGSSPTRQGPCRLGGRRCCWRTRCSRLLCPSGSRTSGWCHRWLTEFVSTQPQLQPIDVIILLFSGIRKLWDNFKLWFVFQQYNRGSSWNTKLKKSLIWMGLMSESHW
jgi:hypothetical protein